VFGNKDLRAEILAAFLLIVAGSVTGVGGFLLAMRSANLEKSRYLYDLLKDQREVMHEFAREIPRHLMLLRQMSKNRLWLEATLKGEKSEYIRPSDKLSTTTIREQYNLDKDRWFDLDDYDAVCAIALATFAPPQVEDGWDRSRTDIDTVTRAINDVNTLLGIFSQIHYGTISQSAAWLDEWLENADPDKSDPDYELLSQAGKRLAALIELDNGVRDDNSDGSAESLGSDELAIERRIAIIVSAYEKATAFAYRRAIREIQARIDQQYQELRR